MRLFFNSIKASFHSFCGIFRRSQFFLPQSFYGEYTRTLEECIKSAAYNINNGNLYKAASDYNEIGSKYKIRYRTTKKQLKELKREIKRYRKTNDSRKLEQSRMDKEVLRERILYEMQCAESYFRKARKILKNEGFDEQARKLYVYEKDAQRDRAWELKDPFWHNRAGTESYSFKAVSWLFLTFSKCSCRYGVSIGIFAAIVLIVIFSFGITYYLNPWGIFEFDGDGIRWDGEKSSFDFSTSMYFSVVTFATLGYGDIYPVSIAARILASFEVITGYSMFGVLVALIARKLISI